MRATLVFLIFALLAAVAFAQGGELKEGQTFKVEPEIVKDAEQVGKNFKEEECTQVKEVTCQYLKKCSKVAKENECLKWEKFQVCVEEKLEEYKQTKEVCVQLETFDRFQPDKCYRCLKKGTEEVPAQRTVCAKHETQQKCVERGPRPMCEEYQLVKHCYETVPPYNVEGTKTCQAGQEVFFTLQPMGANEKPRLIRQCRAATKYPTAQCHGVLDPHMKGIKNNHFEFQHAGDFKFIVTSDGAFECHVRLQHVISGAGWTGPTAFACRVNGIDVLVWDQDSFRLNGHTVVVTATAPLNLPEGGSIRVEGKRIKVIAANRAEFWFDKVGPYTNGAHKYISGNFYGVVPSDLQVQGICGISKPQDEVKYWLKDRASGLFPFAYEAKILQHAFIKREATAQDVKNAEAECAPIFDPKFRPIDFKNCVEDILATNFVNKEAVLAGERAAAAQLK